MRLKPSTINSQNVATFSYHYHFNTQNQNRAFLVLLSTVMNFLKYIILLGLIACTCATSIQHRGDTADDDADENPDSGEIPAFLRAGSGGLKSSTASSDPREKVKESSSSEEDNKKPAVGSISSSGIRPRPPVTSAPEVSPLPSGKNNSTFISSIRVQKRALKDNSTAPGAHFGNSRPSRQAQNVPKPPVRRPAVAQPPTAQVGGANKHIPTPNRRPARAANSTIPASNKPSTTFVNSTSISSSKPSSSSSGSRPPPALLTINNPSSSSSSFGKPSSTFIISPSTTSNSTKSRQTRQIPQGFLGEAETEVEGAEEISSFSSHQTVNSTSPLFVTGIKN